MGKLHEFYRDMPQGAGFRDSTYRGPNHPRLLYDSGHPPVAFSTESVNALRRGSTTGLAWESGQPPITRDSGQGLGHHGLRKVLLTYEPNPEGPGFRGSASSGGVDVELDDRDIFVLSAMNSGTHHPYVDKKQLAEGLNIRLEDVDEEMRKLSGKLRFGGLSIIEPIGSGAGYQIHREKVHLAYSPATRA